MTITAGLKFMQNLSPYQVLSKRNHFVMENQKKKPAGHEDEIGAAINDVNKKKEKVVDSFKTGSKKQKRYFDQPFDEQMHDPDSSE